VLCYAIGMAAYCVHAADSVIVQDAVAKIDFDNSSLWTKTPHYGLSDSGETNQFLNTYWWSSSTNGNYSVMRAYEPHEQRYSGFGVGNPQPDYMKSEDDNLGLLDFSTAVVLYRAANKVSEDGSSTAVPYKASSAVPFDQDVFFDQLVQFVRRDELAVESIEPFLPSEARFACWLPADTNVLTITAGRYAYDGTVYLTNYITVANVETGRWYRLTARAIDSARTDGGSEKMPAMVFYLDGVRVTCGADYAIGDDAEATAANFRGSSHYAARALFPSMWPVMKAAITRLKGLAVRGEGRLDDLGVVNLGNPLVPGGEITEVELLVSVDPVKITNVCVTVTSGEDVVTNTTAGETLTIVTVAPGDKVNIEVKTIETAAPSKWVIFCGNKGAVKGITNFKGPYNFTMADSFELSDPVVARVDAELSNFEVKGKYYESMKSALAAAWGDDGDGPRKLAMHQDVTLSRNAAVDNGQMHVLPEYSLCFDLCGHVLRGDHFRAEAAIYNQGRLTIIDSVGGGAIVAPGTAIEIAASNTALEVNYEQTSLTLGDREIRGDFTVTGRVVCTKGELILKGGSYFTPPDLMPTKEFYLNQYVAPERFYAVNDTTRDPNPGALWSVSYDGRFQVKFEVPHGGPVPVYTNVDTTVGAYLTAPAITNAAGYTVTNWYVKGTTPRLDWNLSTDAVTNDMTLVGQQRVDSYSITYAKATQQAGWPTAYTVESEYQELPVPAKIPNYNFVGWRDNATGRAITAIGAGAKWAEIDELVTGDLKLVAEWQPDVLKWTNIGSYSSESNGYYSGTWRFTVPAGGDITVGRRIVVDEIAFCLVNPLTLPKSAPYLAVTPIDGQTEFSATRPMGYDSTTGEYTAATNTLANGRVKLSYRFTNLTVGAGAENIAQFSESAGSLTPFSGFLRLAVKPLANDAVFGNCQTPDDYQIYCPVYEVYGHVKGDVE